MSTLNVLVSLDGENFFAQGIEVDYFAEARAVTLGEGGIQDREITSANLAEVISHFEEGLARTLALQIKMFGDAKNFVNRPTPIEHLFQFRKNALEPGDVPTHISEINLDQFPFTHIAYYVV
jgi:hypothetical protein